MFNQKRQTVFTLSILLALLFAAMLPLTALADDDVPPQPEDAPIVVEEPVTEGPATEEPVADVPTEDLTLPQMLEAVPEDTALVVLDEQGQPLPLVTEEAAQAMVSGDPMWCPSGVLPGGTGCTAKHPSFSALITDLTNPAYSGAGTIYIAYDYDSTVAGDVGSDFVFDYNLVGLYNSLVVQGGWNFVTNTVTGTSTIVNTNLTFLDWGNTDGGTLTFNNLLIDGGFLRIEDSDDFTTEADITLNNVTVTNSDIGTAIDSGIGITTTGNIVLNNVNAFDNKLIGVYAITTDGDVTVNGGSFNDNGAMAGLLVGTNTGNTTLNNLTATGNKGYGVFGVGGTLTVNGGQFNDNDFYGLGGGSHGNIILNDVTATGNGMIGAILMAPGDVTVNRGNFSNNGETGVGVQNGGNVMLNNVTATGNTVSGAGILSMFGNVSVVCGNYSGLTMLVGGDVYLGGPVITGSGLNVIGGSGTVIYGECPKPVVEEDQIGKINEAPSIIPVTGKSPICDGEQKVTLKAGDAFGVYEKLCGFVFQLTAADTLPGDLPSGAIEIASLKVQLTAGGTPQDALPSGGKITLKFPIPEGTDIASLVVLFWNGSDWVEASGGNVVDGFYVIQVEKPGNYTLATK